MSSIMGFQLIVVVIMLAVSITGVIGYNMNKKK
jgi:hypothetical protein